MINLTLLLTTALTLLGIAIVLVFVRLLRGPSLPDRVVAFELLASVGIGLIAVYAITFDQPRFLDVAFVLALVSFLGTIAFAHYLERRTDK
jgi:multicomponent Na+:H+ antiporter subunit F